MPSQSSQPHVRFGTQSRHHRFDQRCRRSATSSRSVEVCCALILLKKSAGLQGRRCRKNPIPCRDLRGIRIRDQPPWQNDILPAHLSEPCRGLFQHNPLQADSYSITHEGHSECGPVSDVSWATCRFASQEQVVRILSEPGVPRSCLQPSGLEGIPVGFSHGTSARLRPLCVRS